jgi:uncharacterized protein (DUF924 family)
VVSGAQADAERVLAFWFADAASDPARAAARVPTWFAVDPAFDAAIGEQFGALVARAGRGELAGWEASPRGALAAVILLDQFPRNLFRGSAAAFAHDAAALATARRALAAGHQRALAPVEHLFLLLPFEHAESLAAQDECVARASALARDCPPEWREVMRSFVPYAEQHRAIVERFGRFPHRNAALGRASTPAEQAYLAGEAEHFGQAS